MNLLINQVRGQLYVTFDKAVTELKKVRLSELQETQHIADETRSNSKHPWSIRAAAEIVFAAATMVTDNAEFRRQDDDNISPILPTTTNQEKE